MQAQAIETRYGGMGILALVGLIGAVGMCCADGYTSFMCMKSFFVDQLSNAAFWFPLCLAFLTIGFTAYSTEFIEEALSGQVKGGKPGLFVMILLVCICYDWVTSLGGMLVLMTGVPSALEAVEKADGVQKAVCGVMAVVMVLSPFIVGKFFHKVKEDPGIIGKFFRGFFGG